MIGKITAGKGFGGLLNYLLDKGKHQARQQNPSKSAEIMGGNMGGSNSRELRAEFKQIRNLRKDIAKPVWHCSLSAPPGEKLSNERWSQIADTYLDRMGIDRGKHQYAIIRHFDQAHEHVHIVVNRISLKGKVWDRKNERYKCKTATRYIEQEFQLSQTKETHRLHIDRGIIAWMERNEKITPKLLKHLETKSKSIDIRNISYSLLENSKYTSLEQINGENHMVDLKNRNDKEQLEIGERLPDGYEEAENRGLDALKISKLAEERALENGSFAGNELDKIEAPQKQHIKTAWRILHRAGNRSERGQEFIGKQFRFEYDRALDRVSIIRNNDNETVLSVGKTGNQYHMDARDLNLLDGYKLKLDEQASRFIKVAQQLVKSSKSIPMINGREFKGKNYTIKLEGTRLTVESQNREILSIEDDRIITDKLTNQDIEKVDRFIAKEQDYER